MTNPASTRRSSVPAPTRTDDARARRRGIARALPVGTCLVASLLLAAAAAADGKVAALGLAVWVALLVVGGMWLTVPRRSQAPRRQVLVLADLDEDGTLGDARTLPLVPTPAAVAVVRRRPQG